MRLGSALGSRGHERHPGGAAWAIRSCAPARRPWGGRASFVLPGAGSGTGRRSIAGSHGVGRRTAARVVAAWLDTYRSAVARSPRSRSHYESSPTMSRQRGGPTMSHDSENRELWQSRRHHGLSRDLGELCPHASRKSPRFTKRRRKRPHKSRETGRNDFYSGHGSHSADPPPRYGRPSRITDTNPRSWSLAQRWAPIDQTGLTAAGPACASRLDERRS
jgi:hypothetical protein